MDMPYLCSLVTLDLYTGEAANMEIYGHFSFVRDVPIAGWLSVGFNLRCAAWWRWTVG